MCSSRDTDTAYSPVGGRLLYRNYLPFLRDLGTVIYEVEMIRERVNPPNLSRFNVSE